MGYVHDTGFAQFIPPNVISASAGTWTLAVASNVWSNNRSAAAAAATVYVPIIVPSNVRALKGAQLVSVEFMYSIATADLTDFATAALYKDTLQPTAASGSGTLNTAASVTVTLDTGHDTAAERKAQDEHRLVMTLSTPVFVDNDEAFHAEFVLDCATTSVVKVFGAIANYTFRA
jgi:hypothetical protein